MFSSRKSDQKPRRKIFINKEVQSKILWRCVIFWAVYHFIMLHTLFGFEFMAYLVSIMNGGNVQSLSQLYSTFLGKYYPIILTALSLLPFLALDMLKMSHRVVGPLVPFQRAMKKLREGKKVDEVKLREDDLMSEFLGEFNEFLKWHNSQQESELSVSEDNETEIGQESPEEQLVDEVAAIQQLTQAEMKQNEEVHAERN